MVKQLSLPIKGEIHHKKLVSSTEHASWRFWCRIKHGWLVVVKTHNGSQYPFFCPDVYALQYLSLSYSMCREHSKLVKFVLLCNHRIMKHTIIQLIVINIRAEQLTKLFYEPLHQGVALHNCGNKTWRTMAFGFSTSRDKSQLAQWAKRLQCISDLWKTFWNLYVLPDVNDACIYEKLWLDIRLIARGWFSN